MVDFVHLHLHSEYSLLDGACRIEDIPRMAKEKGQKAVALTDHGVMYGAVAFYKACKNEGIKPIIGCEVYVAPQSRFDKKRTPDYFNCHLILLCKNETGYKNLIHMVSRSFIDGFYVKPRIDDELLSKYSEGLICLTGCMSGHISRALLNSDIEEAERYTEKLISYFGKENLFVEIQNNGVPEQSILNSQLARIASKYGLGLAATNDVHYLKKSDADTQAILTCIQMGTKITDGRPLGFEKDEYYFRSSEEMEELFKKYPQAIENTGKIADMCNFDFEFGKNHMPVYSVPEGFTANSYLSKLALDGLEKRINEKSIVFDGEYTKEDYLMRAKYELMIIAKMGYSEYYLIVWDFVSSAKSRGITVGPGRGSGAGSLVAYLIGITDVDSIKYKLLFERFLNPERVSMPDFDIDFRDDMRDGAIKYVTEKYGSDRVSQIITFGTMAARAAVRDVGRALGMSYSDVDRIAKAIPQKIGITIKDALEGELGRIYGESSENERLINTAMSIEGMPRHASVHAAGVLITENALDTYVPLSTSGESVIAQFDMDTIASLGLLKFDFLAVRYLTVVSSAEDEIRNSDPSFSIEKIPMDDEKTFSLISAGDTDGLFQLESPGMKRMLSNMRPDCISDIILAISLYRPGPMESIPLFLENRKNKSAIKYDIPCLEEILSETSGVIVYQEQVMQICRKVANYSYGKADVVRRAMAKKKSAEMEKEREDFLKGAKENFIDEEKATKLFNDMAGFAKYAFNKSHAAAYAITSYRTAYLKANYPAQYYSALLSAFRDDSKTAAYIADAKRHGVNLLSPDVNSSGTFFTTDGKNIRYGLLSIKGIGKNISDNISYERSKKPFESFVDFTERMAAYSLSRQALAALISVGAFDSFGIYRSKLLDSFEKILDYSEERFKNSIVGQTDLFSSLSEKEVKSISYEFPDIPELPIRTMMNMEKEYMGFYISGGLLDEYGDHLKEFDTVSLSDIISAFSDESESEKNDSFMDEKKVFRIAGVIKKIVRKNTKAGATMAFVTLEDKTSEIEVILFPKTYEKCSGILMIDSGCVFTGNVSVKEDEAPKFIAFDSQKLLTNHEYKRLASIKAAEGSASHVSFSKSSAQSNEAVKEKPVFSKLYVRVPNLSSDEYKRAYAIGSIFSDGGNCELIFYDESAKEYKKSALRMNLSDFILSELYEICGKDNVIPK